MTPSSSPNTSTDLLGNASQAVTESMRSAPLHLLRRALQRYAKAWQNAVPLLSPPQYAVLLAISRIRGLNQSALSEITAIDPATLAELLGRLEKKGLLNRLEDPNHSRRNLLEITAEGLAELQQAEACEARVRNEVLGMLSSEEQQAFITILNKIVG